jgi:prepilin peptidase CpaA
MMLVASIAICWVAAAIDIRTRRIPNWLTYSAMFLGVGHHTLSNGLHGFLFGAAGLCLGLALLILFYLSGGMGAGDVKLLGAVGALLGPKGVFFAFIFTALVGGVYAIILLLVRFRLVGTAVRLNTMFGSLEQGVGPAASHTGGNENTPVLKYGLAIAIGVSLSLLWNAYGR